MLSAFFDAKIRKKRAGSAHTVAEGCKGGRIDRGKDIISMKKFFALVLALAVTAAVAACGGGDTSDSAPNAAPGQQEAGSTEGAVDPDELPDNMTSADGRYQVAFVTDVGQLKDKSFNQGTYDGVKLYAAGNGLSYKYYQPANGDQATDEDRADAMEAAVGGGAEVVVAAGFMQESALKAAAAAHPDVPFVFVDGYPLTLEDGTSLANVAGISFREEQSGYFAGYAVVMDGFTKLGFFGGGGGTNPACCRFGYGFVQGANDAAAALGVEVDVNFSWEYGASFGASPELQTMASGWYANGTEVIFACGGAMFQSIAAAASANDGYVVGVDVDQSGDSDAVVTSAIKGLSDAVQWAVAKVYDGSFSEIGGVGTALGVEQNAVGLPTDSGSWRLETYTVAEYEELFQKMRSGELTVDAEYDKLEQDYSNLTLHVI